ncbi:MAG: transcriptional regulator [Gallionellales bacterium GWA2_60_18]|nr:MAG: transcriptional regulator [Gallionellales bacterium GWA2_60_18]
MHGLPESLIEELQAGRIIPYLGPDLLDPAGPVPASQQTLVSRLTAKVPVPSRIRGNLTAVAQYIENFKHRKTLSWLMREAFAPGAQPGELHHWLAAMPLPLIVNVWYDDAMHNALAASGRRWGLAQGVSRAEHKGDIWFKYYDPEGQPVSAEEAAGWETLLYEPMGAVKPCGNFIISDSDFVEVLTEIDIQTPIPAIVQQLRTERGLLFLGCRFRTQLQRAYARQIMKRSAGPHYAVLPEELTRNEQKFLAEQNIQCLKTSVPLADRSQLSA